MNMRIDKKGNAITKGETIKIGGTNLICQYVGSAIKKKPQLVGTRKRREM